MSEPREQLEWPDQRGDMLLGLVKRMENLEINNIALSKENATLKAKVETLNSQVLVLNNACTDLAMKVAVLRKPALAPASQRVFSTFELLEQILVLCPSGQIFAMQKVSKSFEAVVLRSAPLLSHTFRNPKDVLLRTDHLPPARQQQLFYGLKMNSYWGKQWQSHPSRVAIDIKLPSAPKACLSFRITMQLAATFEYRVTSPADTKAALRDINTSLGRSYLTRPALPTSVWVSFLDTSILRDKYEYLRACRSPTSVPPNVTAQAQLRAATVLEMLQVADLLHRYHYAKWVRHEGEVATWRPEGAVEEEEATFSLIIAKPVYSGWRAVQPRSGHVVFDT